MNAWAAELNVQVRLLASVGSAARAAAGATVNIACSCASLSPPVGPVCEMAVTLVATVSVRSASVMVSVPEAVRPALVSFWVLLSLSLPCSEMTGASSVPLMVTVTVCVSVPPAWPSSVVTV